MSLQQELEMKSPIQPLLRETVLNILHTNDQYVIYFSRLFRLYGLTLPQYNILDILQNEGAPLTVLEIANRTIAVAPSVTGIIDRLEREGFVTRERSIKDRRVIYVTLTEKGQTTFLAINEPLKRLEKQTSRYLTEAELKELIRLLEKTRGILLAEQEDD